LALRGGGSALKNSHYAVANHGVSLELLDRQSQQFKAFFNLPPEEKNKLVQVQQMVSRPLSPSPLAANI
jgi:isopenicillin N synthase-like dioxygenase